MRTAHLVLLLSVTPAGKDPATLPPSTPGGNHRRRGGIRMGRCTCTCSEQSQIARAMQAESGADGHLEYLVRDEWKLGVDAQAALSESLHMLLPS